MSLNKAIQYGKEKRKSYRGSARWDHSCRNHGSCGWCLGNRTHQAKRSTPADLKEQMVCEFCHKEKPDVCERACCYDADVHNDPNHMEVICDACEEQHGDDI